MTRVRVLLIVSAIALVAPGVTAQAPWFGSVPAGEHQVGFRLTEVADGGRSLRSPADSTVVAARPVRVYMWYPALPDPTAEALCFGRYVELADNDPWPAELMGAARGRTAFDRSPLAHSLPPEAYAELLGRPMAAYENAQPVGEDVPLLVFGQGLYYESPVAHAALCELLASHGFAVVTTPLAGTHSPLVQLDVVDLETQVRDLELAVDHARRQSFVSRNRLGVLGFDMGAMAALILAMRNPEVDALATLDGAILYGHVAGIPVDSPSYDPARLRCPWLHATQRRFGERPEAHDGPDLPNQAIYSDRHLLLVDGLDHSSFTSFALIVDRQPMMGYWPPLSGGEKGLYEAVCRVVLRFLQAKLNGDTAAAELLAGRGDEAAPVPSITFMHRKAGRPRPLYSDFLNALLTGETDAARGMVASLRTDDPDGPLTREAVLNRLGYHLLSSWQLVDSAVAAFEINRELHPESPNVHDSLGEALLLDGREDAARACFLKVLELDPDNQRAVELITEIDARCGAESPAAAEPVVE